MVHLTDTIQVKATRSKSQQRFYMQNVVRLINTFQTYQVRSCSLRSWHCCTFPIDRKMRPVVGWPSFFLLLRCWDVPQPAWLKRSGRRCLLLLLLRPAMNKVHLSGFTITWQLGEGLGGALIRDKSDQFSLMHDIRMNARGQTCAVLSEDDFVLFIWEYLCFDFLPQPK